MEKRNQATLIKISKKDWLNIGVEGDWISLKKYAQVDFDIPIPSIGGGSLFSGDTYKRVKNIVGSEEEKKEEKNSTLESAGQVSTITLPVLMEYLSKRDQSKLLSGISIGGKQVTPSMLSSLSKSQREYVLNKIRANHARLLDDLALIYSDPSFATNFQNKQTSILGRVKGKIVPKVGVIASGATGIAAGYFAGNYLFGKVDNLLSGDQTIRKSAIDSYPKGKTGFYAGAASFVSLVNSTKGINSVLDHLGNKIKQELDYASKNI